MEGYALVLSAILTVSVLLGEDALYHTCPDELLCLMHLCYKLNMYTQYSTCYKLSRESWLMESPWPAPQGQRLTCSSKTPPEF